MKILSCSGAPRGDWLRRNWGDYGGVVKYGSGCLQHGVVGGYGIVDWMFYVEEGASKDCVRPKQGRRTC